MGKKARVYIFSNISIYAYLLDMDSCFYEFRIIDM